MTALAAQEPVRLLLVCGSLRAGSTNAAVLKTVQAVAPGGVETASYDAWINASGTAAPTGGADAHESLRKVLGYVGAEMSRTPAAPSPSRAGSSMLTGSFAMTRSAPAWRGCSMPWPGI